jgi:hypothetical protein
VNFRKDRVGIGKARGDGSCARHSRWAASASFKRSWAASVRAVSQGEEERVESEERGDGAAFALAFPTDIAGGVSEAI